MYRSSRRLLTSLRRVNHLFYAEFSPILWTQLDLRHISDFAMDPSDPLLQRVRIVHAQLEAPFSDYSTHLEKILAFLHSLPSLAYFFVSICNDEIANQTNPDLEIRRLSQERLAAVFADRPLLAGTWAFRANLLTPRYIYFNIPELRTLKCEDAISVFTPRWPILEDVAVVIRLNGDTYMLPASFSQHSLRYSILPPSVRLNICSFLCATPLSAFIDTISSRLTHLRLGNIDSGSWEDPLLHGEFPALRALAINVTCYDNADFCCRMIAKTSRTMTDVEIRVEDNLLALLLLLSSALFGCNRDIEPSPTLKNVQILPVRHWHLDSTSDGIDLRRYQTQTIASFGSTQVLHRPEAESFASPLLGIREEHARPIDEWIDRAWDLSDDRALMPLKEDLRAVLAGFFFSKGVAFEILGTEAAEFVYDFPVSACVGHNAPLLTLSRNRILYLPNLKQRSILSPTAKTKTMLNWSRLVAAMDGTARKMSVQLIFHHSDF